MTYSVKPLPFDPKTIKGLSEKILVSHYENNYTGAVNRLNAKRAGRARLWPMQSRAISAAWIAGVPSLSRWARRKAQAQGGCC
jgi:hypothetical protein